MDSLQIILVIFVVLSFGFVAYWAVAWWRLDRAMRMSISMTEGRDLDEPADGWPSVSVIIPAHNEEEMIARCVKGMLSQRYPNLQFIFVLDRCSDRTEALLDEAIDGDDRFTVKSISKPPPCPAKSTASACKLLPSMTA